MQWCQIRQTYPEQWLVIEALTAHTTQDQVRQLDEVAVIAECVDGQDALDRYRKLHQQFPSREFYFIHTSREQVNFEIRRWLGVRTAYGFAATL